MPTLNRNLLADIQVLLPSVDEQRAIARVLRTVQRVKEQTEQVVEASTRLLQSLALNLFGPLEADAAMVQRPLGELVEVLDRMRVPLNRAERAKRPGKYPYCGANGIVDYIDGYLFEGEHLLVAEDGGEWGRFESSAYLMDGRFWVNNHAHILRAHDDVTTNVFLMHYLNYADIQSFISGSTRGKLNQGVLKSIPVPLPSLAEQMRITQALEAVGRKHRSEVNRAAALAHLFTTLLQELMTGRTRADDVAGAS